ncbi:MAG TPA: response regulator transcription factor [Candidatus Acidoferrales bacterium]|jgi:DNA-binding NarL/FixJ family response regulator|nr:response regulator transcription factor [Candidatus Acidoferrales bacterium]
MPVTVCLVEDNHEVRESCAALLNGAPGLKCLGAYCSAEEALEKIPLAPPDVALVDIHLPGMSGIECVAKLKAELPDLQILMLTLYERGDLIFNSLRAGANGYLLKSMSSADLIRAVEQVHAGGVPMTMSVARKVIACFQNGEPPASPVEALTPREQEILEQLGKGCYYREISESLGISLSTVRTHLHSVYRKLHVKSRTQAVIKFHESGRPE